MENKDRRPSHGLSNWRYRTGPTNRQWGASTPLSGKHIVTPCFMFCPPWTAGSSSALSLCFSYQLSLPHLHMAHFVSQPLISPPKREIRLVARYPWVGWPWVRCTYLWAARVGPPRPAGSVSCWGTSQWKGLFSSKLQPIADCVIANSNGESSCFSDKHSLRITLHMLISGNERNRNQIYWHENMEGRDEEEERQDWNEKRRKENVEIRREKQNSPNVSLNMCVHRRLADQ